jgi:error-prone DNA polymerase
MLSSFVHLHTHSSYSPMQGVPSLEALCQAVRTQGHDTLALTDTNGLYGAIRFIAIAREAGLKPVLGAELVHEHHRAVLLAKTPDGYANLCRILSARHADDPFDFVHTVMQHRDGVVILSDDQVALTEWRQHSREDLYVELTPGSEMQALVAFGRRVGLPPVATCRTNMLTPHDYQIHRLLRAIAENTTLSRLREDQCAARSHWLMPEQTLVKYFPHVPEALTNTRLIANQCYTDWDFKETIFPSFRHLSANAAYETLQEKTYKGAHWR